MSSEQPWGQFVCAHCGHPCARARSLADAAEAHRQMFGRRAEDAVPGLVEVCGACWVEFAAWWNTLPPAQQQAMLAAGYR